MTTGRPVLSASWEKLWRCLISPSKRGVDLSSFPSSHSLLAPPFKIIYSIWCKSLITSLTNAILIKHHLKELIFMKINKVVVPFRSNIQGITSSVVGLHFEASVVCEKDWRSFIIWNIQEAPPPSQHPLHRCTSTIRHAPLLRHLGPSFEHTRNKRDSVFCSFL